MLYLKLNKKGQNTAEYAILIALVVAAVVAMQTFAQRSLQARVRDGNTYMKKKLGNTTQTLGSDASANKVEVDNANLAILGDSAQYEPYYLESDYTTDRANERVSKIKADRAGYAEKSVRDRTAGYQKSTFDSAETSGDGAAAPNLQ